MSDLLLTAIVLLLALLGLVIIIRLVHTVVRPAPAPVANPSHEEAAGVLVAAQAQAEKIVREANFITRRVTQDIERTLKEQAGQQAAAADERLQEITQHLEEAMQQHLAGYGGRLAKHATALEQELLKIDERERAKLRKELEAYEQRRINALEGKIADRLPALVAEVAGQAIPLSEHEKLARQALQRAAEAGWQ